MQFVAKQHVYDVVLKILLVDCSKQLTFYVTALLEYFTYLTALLEVVTALLEYLDFFNGIQDLAIKALYLFRIAAHGCLIPAEIPHHDT